MVQWKLTLASILALMVLASCGLAAQPTPAAPPAPVVKQAPAPAPTAVAKPAVAPTAAAKPAAAPTAVAKPAEAAKPAAKAPAPAKTEAAWQAEWDKTLAAAKKEGKVVVAGPPGDTWRTAARDFGKLYPEITLEWNPVPTGDAIPKFVSEQRAGLYLWDVYVGGGGSNVQQLKPTGALQSLRSALILPEVLDNSKWHQGFDNGWMDVENQYVYAWLGYVQTPAAVNRNLAPKSEVATLDDLLDPKWKGKIAIQEPRRPGPGDTHLTHLLAVKGEAWMRRLLSQELAPMTDTRMMLEGLVRGRYAAIIGHRAAEFLEFKGLRVADHLENIYPRDVPLLAGHGSGAVSIMKTVPNPNATKLFVNWLLSKQGQEGFVRETGNNSRRLDVAGPEDTAPKAGVQYVDPSHEKYVPLRDTMNKLTKEMLK